MDKKLIGLYKQNTFINNDIKFFNTEWWTPNALTYFEYHFGLHASVIFFRPKYVWFLVQLDVGYHPNSSGELAEIIVRIIPLE